MLEHALWSEKYRPDKISDCVLPERIKKVFNKVVSDSSLNQHLLLSGTPGTGKTTAALAICNELDADYLMINASLESQIDVLRTKISQFCSSVSMTGRPKIVILDEIDGSTAPAFQLSLRGIQEKFAKNCRFILTCNNKGRILEAIQSRCSCIDFSVTKKEKAEMMSSLFKRMCFILDNENIKYEQKVLAQVVHDKFPDMRSLLNELQRYSANEIIDAGILTSMSSTDIDKLLTMLKDKDFKSIRQWTAQNADQDLLAVILSLYKLMDEHLQPSSIPEVVMLIDRYQIDAPKVASIEIHAMTFFVELMMGASWK